MSLICFIDYFLYSVSKYNYFFIRLNELDLVHDELQARLEEQTKARMALEAELDKCHRKWSERYLSLKNERDEWEKRVIDEQKKNEQLLKKINDKEKIILEMLQHKVSCFRNLNFCPCNFLRTHLKFLV